MEDFSGFLKLLIFLLKLSADLLLLENLLLELLGRLTFSFVDSFLFLEFDVERILHDECVKLVYLLIQFIVLNLLGFKLFL